MGNIVMIEEKTETQTVSKSQTHDVSAWLRETVTLSLPRWALVAAGLAALVLLLVALD
ncbi:hypothetical protein [Roseicyclus sp.]|uniref:hypothetical protein n=1 Tax=Roseicyclus sp. TaxID=1914329 RepID=UPI003F6B7651